MDERLGSMPQNRRLALTAILVAITLFSIVVLRGILTSPDTYSRTITALDEKKGTVMALSASSVSASAALTLLPDDIATPQAEELAELGKLFVVVLAAILLEKYLLTTFGFAATVILIPLACIFGIVMLFAWDNRGLRASLRSLIARLVLLAAVLVLTVPASVWLSSSIESIYQESVDSTIEAAQAAEKAAEETAEEVQENEATNALEFFQQQLGKLQSAAGDAVNTVGNTVAGVPQLVGNFIEAIVMMLVLSCGIPIVVLLFFLWVVKIIVGVDARVPVGMRLPSAGWLPEGRDSAAS